MGDDMGYSDIGCFGGEVLTPNLDGLASNGIRYAHFYNSARCCPTRASLLTGLYPQQAGVGHMMNDRGTPAFHGDLSRQAVTIAEVLKGAGYATYMSGKWHVTPYLEDRVRDHPRHNWPTNRGFDRFFGTIKGAGSLYDPSSLAYQDSFIAPTQDFYYTDAISDFAVRCIEEHDDSKPFFLYVSHVAAHWPLQAPPEDIAKYSGKYAGGWDDLRQSRLEKLSELGIIPGGTPLAPRDQRIPNWEDDSVNRKWHARNMEVYAAMIDRMDQGIGALTNTLDNHGLSDNTLIFFLQDNGACAEELDWISRSAGPADVPLGEEEWQTRMVPLFTRTGEPIHVMDTTVAAGPANTYHAYGKYWAHASNTPFGMYKHWVHEGGIATPLIAHWPAGIDLPGSLCKAPSHLIDIMATCVDVSNADYPEHHAGSSIHPMEGVSLRSTFGGAALPERTIFWEHEGNRAVRSGDWKLVSPADFNSFIWDRTDTLDLSLWELYNLTADRSEQHNMAAKDPTRVYEMAQAWQKWANRTGIVPRPYFD